jgi:IS1 family transposase
LSVFPDTKYPVQEAYYDCWEVDEFWPYVGKKSSKVWFISACHRDSSEIVAFVRGKRDWKAAKDWKKQLSDFGVNYGCIAIDN